MSRPRVVVTGLGAVTPGGRDVASTWAALRAGRSAVARSPRLEAAGCRSQIAAEVRDFDVAALPLRHDPSRAGRSAHLALAAALEAWRDAGLDAARPAAARCGVIVGTGFGDTAETFRQAGNLLDGGVRAVQPGFAPRAMANAAAAHVSLELGLGGPSFTTGSACAAAAHALALAARLIQAGDADVVVAGGSEEISCVLAAAAFDGLRALSTRNAAPERASRPFDRARDGFVLGEGAGMVVLESAESARARGARVHAVLAGVGMTSEAYHVIAPDPDGVAAAGAMRRALEDAGRDPAAVSYVNAHGTSTPLNDAMETRAIRRALGRHADRVAVSATKSMLGHLLGASAAIGFIATVRAIADGVVHPTINQDEPDPACDLDYVPNRARALAIEVALVNAFAFGGHCVSLAVEPPA